MVLTEGAADDVVVSVGVVVPSAASVDAFVDPAVVELGNLGPQLQSSCRVDETSSSGKKMCYQKKQVILW